jgi:hypothetical protein
VALASLADPSQPQTTRLTEDLLKRIEASWDTFPRTQCAGARSLRDALRPWLGLETDATLADVFAAILEQNPSSRASQNLAFCLLLDRCGGDAAIQQGGRGYLPRFCDQDANPTWDFSKSSLAAGTGKASLAQLLHGAASQQQLDALAAEMELSWTVKISPGKFYVGQEAHKRLTEAIDNLLTRCQATNKSVKLTAELAQFPDAIAELEKLKSHVSKFKELEIPRNRKAAPDLTFATIAFKFFPSALTEMWLRQSVAKPRAPLPSNKPASDAVDFSALGDDPIKLARGSRGYVFRAFTALPRWNPVSPGKPAWREFDIAAFKEALKSLSQFYRKTKDREDSKHQLEGKVAILLGGEVSGWQPEKGEDGEAGEMPIALDADLLTLARDLEARLSEDLADTLLGESSTRRFGSAEYVHRSGEWQISAASLRGLRDIAAKWHQVLGRKSLENNPLELEDKLRQVVKDFQKEEKNKKSIGSIPLLLTICEAKYWPLWWTTETNSGEAIENAPTVEASSSNRFLYQMVELHSLMRDYDRALEPINLTPADPIFSRRLYMFSDVTDKKAKVKFGKPFPSTNENGAVIESVECAIALMDKGGMVSERRIKLGYTAPRLRRDGLLGEEGSNWLQPMIQALDIKLPDPEPSFDSAMSLMPDFTRGASADEPSRLRLLLNFPKTIEPAWLHQALGKAERWQGQFNGTKDKNLFMHWPGTALTEPAKRNPWHLNSEIIKNGFTILSTDLGQRTAGAWALLRITTWKPESTKLVVSIGHDGTREWFAEIQHTGMHRLPGEDQMVIGPDGKLMRELSGKSGRMASVDEWKDALELAKNLLAEMPENWVGAFKEKSFPEQNDSLLALANRRLTRLATYHRWSCFDPDRPEVASRRAKLLEKLNDELAHWQDLDVHAWKQLIHEGNYVAFREASGTAFQSYRATIGTHLVALANRLAPLRGRSWLWRTRNDGSTYGELVDADLSAKATPKIRGQRGLSMDRLEQLEKLRTLFLRYNRSFDREPGQPAVFGLADRGRESGEPCEQLLEKIDQLKEQRVNQTAHLIQAQALGVRLRGHTLSQQQRKENDVHGEYEKIPGREPVDFIVIENLDRYLTSQGRAPSENSRLMKWSHRAIRDKVKMLAEEPFGIPVVEAPAAYSSRFCAKTGAPGARCEEVSGLEGYLRDQLNARSEAKPQKGKPNPQGYAILLLQLEQLAQANAPRKAKDLPLHTLFIPKPGGPLFLSIKSSQITQADINAAANIGLRAIAAPEALHLIHKVRTEKKGANLLCKRKNAREKAAFGTDAIQVSMAADSKQTKKNVPNFFYDGHRVAGSEQTQIKVSGTPIPVASSVAIWSKVNETFLDHITSINNTRLQKFGLPSVDWNAVLLARQAAKVSTKEGALRLDDDIPM